MTQTITIDGPTTEREDGSIVCIGYYEDSEGRVVSRFAVPPGTYNVDNAVASVGGYSETMDDLPPTDAYYRDNY